MATDEGGTTTEPSSEPRTPPRSRRALPILYCAWVAAAIGLALAAKGFSPENATRLMVIGFLLAQVVLRSRLARVLPRVTPRTRFVVLGTALAAVIEGFHIISMPVFPSLRVGRGTPPSEALVDYALDLAFTVPAYLVILSVMWWFVRRYRYTPWRYTLVMGVAQTLGDGGIFFFIAAPWMFLFLPYPMTNYHAMNVVPFLAVQDALDPERRESAWSYLAVPAVIGTYLVCGATIQIVGRRLGFHPG